MPNKPPPAVICDGYDNEYIVMQNGTNKIISGVIVIFPEEHRWLQPIVEQLGLKVRAGALRLKWEQIDKDKDDMMHNESKETADEHTD